MNWRVVLIKTVKIVASVTVGGYLIFAYSFFCRKEEQILCDRVEVEITNSMKESLITNQEVREILVKSELDPLHQTYSTINLYEIEKRLMQTALIREVVCSKTPSGLVRVEVTQRKPLLRVATESKNYYVDEDCYKIPTFVNFATYIPVITGNVTDSILRNGAIDFVSYIAKDPFWSETVQQIVVEKPSHVELIPRQANHVIVLGSFDNYQEKLRHLRLFYDQVLDKAGWDRYSVISLKYNNQIVATRKDMVAVIDSVSVEERDSVKVAMTLPRRVN